MRASLVIICAATTTILAAATTHAPGPIVTLDTGTFIGATADGVNKFLGIRFAQPPFVVHLAILLDSPAKPTELATSASVIPSRLAPTLANTMLLRSVFHALNKRPTCRFQAGYLRRRSTTLRSYLGLVSQF